MSNSLNTINICKNSRDPSRNLFTSSTPLQRKTNSFQLFHILHSSSLKWPWIRVFDCNPQQSHPQIPCRSYYPQTCFSSPLGCQDHCKHILRCFRCKVRVGQAITEEKYRKGRNGWKRQGCVSEKKMNGLTFTS